MADFEGNPFADPEGINPFADPSVTNVTEPPPEPEQEEYNPFSEDNKKKEGSPTPLLPPVVKADTKAKGKGKAKSQPKKSQPSASPAIMQADEDKPPPYTSGAGPFAQENNEIEKREEEISRREAALRERERNLERLGPAARPNNFPPFPAFCPSPFKPCFYLNINTEVPAPERWKMWTLLGLLIYTWVLLILNLLVAIVGVAAAGDKRDDYLATMGVSILYLILFCPAALFCWFLPVYHAYRRDSSLAYMWFFFVMLFQVLSYLLNGVGIPKLGACGLYNGSELFDDKSQGRTAAGAMFLILGFLWLGAAPVAGVLIFLVHRYYRQSGGSINRATEEAVSGAAKNKAVRGAVKSGVAAGVKASM